MKMRSVVVMLFLASLTLSVAEASVQTDLASASDRGQVAFILVTDQGATDIEAAKEIVQ